MRLMKRIREAIKEDRFPEFVRKYIQNYYSNKENQKRPEPEKDENADGLDDEVKSKPVKKVKKEAKPQESIIENNNSKNHFSSNQLSIPDWVVNALKEVNIDVLAPLDA